MEDFWLVKWRKKKRTNIEKKIDQLKDEYTLPYSEALSKDYNSPIYQVARKNISEGGIPEKIGFEGGSWIK